MNLYFLKPILISIIKKWQNVVLHWNAWNIAQNLPITWRIINGLCKAKCLQSGGKVSEDANDCDGGEIWGQAESGDGQVGSSLTACSITVVVIASLLAILKFPLCLLMALASSLLCTFFFGAAFYNFCATYRPFPKTFFTKASRDERLVLHF